MGKLKVINEYKVKNHYRLGMLLPEGNWIKNDINSCSTCKFRVFEECKGEKIHRFDLFCKNCVHTFLVSHSNVCDKYVKQ
jgi:hypothetical protein